MKAFSIKQPWASLIAHGIKDIENRTWKTNYRGRIYIHASAKVFDGKGHPFTPEQIRIVQHNHEIGNLPRVDELPYSEIIGEVDIVNCVINHPSIWAEKSTFPRQSKPIYNWVLSNPILYDEPIINVKGKLSFWEFKKEDYL